MPRSDSFGRQAPPRVKGRASARDAHHASQEMQNFDPEFSETLDADSVASYEPGDYEPGEVAVGVKKAGVTPVRVGLPTVGRAFYFEKLLVVTEGLSVSVGYKEQKKGCWSRRRAW